MKLCRHLIVLGAAAGLVIPGCTPEEETLIDTGDLLTLTASAKEITLKESDEDKEALKLTWTSASNYGLEEEVYYTLEIASDDTDYADGFSRDMGKSRKVFMAWGWNTTTIISVSPRVHKCAG